MRKSDIYTLNMLSIHSFIRYHNAIIVIKGDTEV